jgi:hypothetical protein
MNKDRNPMSRTIRNAALAAQPRAAAVPRTKSVATALTFALAVFAVGDLLPRTLAQADEASRLPGITITNKVPEFTLTLPDRYVQLKATGDALYMFGTKDRTTGAIVGVYPVGHTIEPRTVELPVTSEPDARQIPALWKTYPIDVTAWHTKPKDGKTSAVRWVQIPLQQQAVSILVIVPAEKEAAADGLVADFLNGLDCPSNWPVERPLTATQRAVRVALGLGLAVLLLAGPPLALRVWLRNVASKMKSNTSTALPLRAPLAALATPEPNNPRYWLRVLAFVLALIAGLVAWLGLIAFDISLIFNRGFGDSFKGTFLFVEFVALLALLVTLGIWASKRRERGRVLIDFGPDQMRSFFLAVGVLCLVAAIASGVSTVTNASSRWSTMLLAPMQLALAAQFLVRSRGRVQITENGIWQNLTLYRWEKIGSYRWVNDSTLVAVNGQGPLSVKLVVPPEHKPALEQILTQHGLTETAI